MGYNSGRTGAQIENILSTAMLKGNTDVFIPVGDYNPATKIFVEDSIKAAIRETELKLVEVIDNLESTKTNAALSANQGRLIKVQIDELSTRLTKAISDNTNSINELRTIVNENKTRLEAVEVRLGEINTLLTSVEQSLKEVAKLKTKVEENEDAIEILNGTGEGSVHKTVEDAISWCNI